MIAFVLFFTIAVPPRVVKAAPISVPESSVDSSVPLTATPVLNGSTTWYYDGLTQIVDDGTGAVIGNTYRYQDAGGKTVTMVNPGTLGDWAEAFGGNRHQVIAHYTDGTMTEYTMTPVTGKQAFSRLRIDDIICGIESNG